MNQKYTIRPLKWTKICDTDDYKVWTAEGWGGWRIAWDEDEKDYTASYCFSDYYDEDSETFRTMKEAKDWCWKQWLERIESCLKKI